MNTTAPFAVTEASQVAVVRRAAQLLAERLGFTETRAGTVALVASELATNLAKHATSGEMLLRALGGERATGEPAGIDLLAIDRGPGMPDFSMSRRDGHSTTGTLGQGLGAIERQAHVFDIYTQPSGSVALARIWRDGPPPAAQQPLYEVGAVQVSKPGEDICGDHYGWRARDDRLTLLIADGLGHGLAAHDASSLAVRVFSGVSEEAPSRMLADIHAALRATRGAAVSALALDIPRGVARYCGLGNIAAVVLPPAGPRRSLVSQNGTAGHTAPRVQEFTYPVEPGSLIIMHSDGLGTHWDLAGYPGLRSRHPSVIAGVLYRDWSRRRDDVTIVVARERRRA